MKKIILLLLFCGNLFAQGEFTVNTKLDTTQRDAHIVRDSQGNYAVVWDSENQLNSNSQSDIVFQLFSSNDEKIGGEQVVNTITDNEQERPAAAMNGSGSFIIAWASHSSDPNSIFDIKARLYKNNLPFTGEFLVNTTTGSSQTKPAAAMDADGNFIITWESWYQDGSNKGIYAQRFNSSGEKAGEEFLVNSTTQFSQGRPVVKYFNSGNFIVIWESWKQDILTPSGYGLFGKIYDAGGNVIKDEFQVNTHTNDYQWFGDIETLSDNSFIIAWCSWEQDGFDGGIYLQKFDSAANKIGSEILVNETTVYYQWLPKIKKLSSGNIAVVWSSWKQDGSREGIYAQIFNPELEKISFETQVNDITEGFQWEPSFIPAAGNELLVVWSGWNDISDYDIIAKRVTPLGPEGSILPETYQHTQGISTSGIHIFVVDSTQLTGDNYEVSFTYAQDSSLLAQIKNLNSGSFTVQDYPLNRGGGTFYLSPEFEGAAVQFIPEFDFSLDTENSYFQNNSGSNIIFEAVNATGNTDLAPIDIAVVWGNTDTLSDGSYAFPLDSAYSVSAVTDIATPFYAWNLMDNERVDMFIIEPIATKNNRWDPGENITFLTPPQYNPGFPIFHAVLNTTKPAGSVIMPSEGDTNFVITKRPLTVNDVYRFQTDPSLITSTEDLRLIPQQFDLKQNYPNPFNPATTIKYSIPTGGMVKINVYNILGEKVGSLFSEYNNAGSYKVLFNGNNLASGIYLYTLEFNKKILVKKMMLLK